MAFESWQAKNWDPEVGSEEFDEFCKGINRPFNSAEDAVEATGVDIEDVMALISTPGFDFTLLNYAAYVRAVRLNQSAVVSCAHIPNRKSFRSAPRIKLSKRCLYPVSPPACF